MMMIVFLLICWVVVCCDVYRGLRFSRRLCLCIWEGIVGMFGSLGGWWVWYCLKVLLVLVFLGY